MKTDSKKVLPLVITFCIGLLIWFLPRPEGLSEEAWHIFAIFIATIAGIILKPMPMGAIAIISLMVAVVTGTLTIDEALGGYQKKAIWLIVMAFFISRGFIKTRLGTRIAYFLVSLFGKSSLGLAYSLVISETFLAPAIPSVTARTGGIILPIADALSRALGSKPNDPSQKKIGQFLVLVCFQASIIACAMFLTAMAANPIVADFAEKLGITLSWGTWALAGIVPGIVSLIIVPLLIYKIAPPEIKHIPDAHAFATEKLKEMGKVKKEEYIMAGVFLLLIVLWVFGRFFGMHSMTAAMVGVSILLITNVLEFDDLMSEKSAWSTFLWFGALVTLAGFLNTFGAIAYFSNIMSGIVSSWHWMAALLALAVLYFYTHYLFASAMAHVGAMFTAFVSIALLAGAPPMLAALLFAFFSNLFGGTTHYGIGSAPVLFGAGYVSVKKWWQVGFLVSIVNIINLDCCWWCMVEIPWILGIIGNNIILLKA